MDPVLNTSKSRETHMAGDVVEITKGEIVDGESTVSIVVNGERIVSAKMPAVLVATSHYWEGFCEIVKTTFRRAEYSGEEQFRRKFKTLMRL